MSVVLSLRELEKSARPDKATFEFGIQITSEGKAFVVKGSAEANVKVTAHGPL